MISKEELTKYIWEDNLSFKQIGDIVGVEYRTISRWADKLEIPKNNIRGRYSAKDKEKSVCLNCNKEFIVGKNSSGKYCSQKCSSEHRTILNYEKYKQDNSILYGQSNMSNYKKHFLKEQDNKCDICGMSNIWNKQELVFILDHIDGNADNNERINLRLICPNCDSQLDTYKSKNKNSARSRYRQTIKVEECI